MTTAYLGIKAISNTAKSLAQQLQQVQQVQPGSKASTSATSTPAPVPTPAQPVVQTAP
jgi:type IV secretory pathway TrbL component